MHDSRSDGPFEASVPAPPADEGQRSAAPRAVPVAGGLPPRTGAENAGLEADPTAGHPRPPADPWRPVRPLIARLCEPVDDLVDALFERSDTGLAVVDRGGVVVRVNPALARMSADAVPGRPVLALFVPEQRAAVWDALRPVLDGAGDARPFASRLPGPEDGYHVRVSAVALREADGTCSGLVLRVHDITVQTRLEARLAHAERLRAVGHLAAGVAHDLNNLLAPILGAADEALGRPDLPPGLADEVRLIRGGAERGAALVRRMLAVGRPGEARPRVLALNEVVQDLCGLLRRMPGAPVGPADVSAFETTSAVSRGGTDRSAMDRRGRWLRLEVELERPGPAVRVDPAHLDRVLVNLVVNARDAMPDGGRVWLRTGRTVLAQALVRGEDTIPAGPYATVEVADEGVGIPPEVLPRIFEPFFTTRRERGGSGLGLASAHGIVRRSGGFIGVESRVGQGTRVRVHLPLHGGATEAAAPEDAGMSPVPPLASHPVSPPLPSGRPGAGRTVLLVDDHDGVRRVTEGALRKHGWRVLAAASAEEALALVAEHGGAGRLDLAVSDVALPGMDGPALLRALRREKAGLPAVLCSGYAGAGLRAEAEALGVPVLQKPHPWRALWARIDAVLGAAAASGVAPEPASGAVSGTPEFT